MTSERPEHDLVAAARAYREPPPAPRERMWQRIDAARASARRSGRTATHVDRPWWRRGAVLWPAAVLAALAVGLTAGRGTAPRSLVPEPGVAVAPARRPATDAFRVMALPTLERTEELFLRVTIGDAPAPDRAAYTSRAVELLAETRLLLDSPAAGDAELRRLLEDLELTLARVAWLTAAPSPLDGERPPREALAATLARNAVLPRLRGQIEAGPVAVGL